MLDENLPTFYLKPSEDAVKHNSTIYLSQYGSDAQPAYALRRPDPAALASKNRYAIAIYDSYNPEILFGEVLLIPKWTNPTLSQEEIRKNGGVVPPPQPILPDEFTIQLYNPDQQVKVKHHPGTWNSAPNWSFDMPQQTFRQPSSSALDRTQSDPTASETTPKINFKWKKDGKLSKDLICSLSGKSTNPDGSKRKNREPDITISIFKHLREITIYEPNLYRVDMEDPKGLEVVLLLGAAVIRDVFFGQMREVFNISEPPRRLSNPTAPRKSDTPPNAPPLSVTIPTSQQIPPKTFQQPPQQQHPQPPPSQVQASATSTRPPPTDPRTQWELDAETARLQKQVAHEERVRKRAEKEETKRVQKMLAAETRQAQRRQEEVDKETERLKKMFIAEQRLLQQQQKHKKSSHSHNNSKPLLPPRQDLPQRHSAPQSYQSSRPPVVGGGRSGPYLQPPVMSNASSSGFFGDRADEPRLTSKKSFFGLRSGNDSTARLTKKQSSIF